MRAQVLERAGARRSTELALPDPVAGQVRVRLRASGVCHSDLHALDGDRTVPLPLVRLGNEGTGVVEATGPEVRDVALGDRVALSWFAPSRRCTRCARGQAWSCTGTRALEHPSALNGVHAFLGLGTLAQATVVPGSAVVAIDPAIDPLDLADQGKRIAGCNYELKRARGAGRPARRRRPADGAGALRMSPMAGRRSTDRGFRASRDVARCV